jgi:hypothetical protein
MACRLSRTHLKNRILVQDRGGAEFQTAGNLLVVEDLKRGTNKDIGPKDIFEMGSNIRGIVPACSETVSLRDAPAALYLLDLMNT